VDADDTLWENNIYFERVLTSVESLLEPLGVDPQSFRCLLNEAERLHIRDRGYGTLNFTRSLVATFENLLPPHADRSLVTRVRESALAIMDRPLEILDHVPETLNYLNKRHTLYLVTKGNPEEQSRKIERSGLRHYFHGVEILREKNVPAFLGLLGKYCWRAQDTWMIGNSPRSDINPALAAGLSAVYIPHPHTWALEHEEPLRVPGMVELQTFADLRGSSRTDEKSALIMRDHLAYHSYCG